MNAKLRGALLALIAIVGVLIFLRSKPKSETRFSAKDLAIKVIEKGSETDFEVRFKVSLKAPNAPVAELFAVEGTLTEYQNAAQDLVTEWKAITRYTVDGKPLPEADVAAILGQSTVTSSQGNQTKHFVGKAFPQGFLRTHIAILDSLFVKTSLANTSTVRQEEVEDTVAFNVDYSFEKDEAFTVVVKKWVDFKNPDVTVDPALNALTYYYDQNAQLLATRGLVRIFYKTPGLTEIGYDFWAKALATRPLAAGKSSFDKSNLSAVDPKSLAADDGKASSASTLTFEDTMKKVALISESMSGKEYYGIFQSLVAQMRYNPEKAGELEQKILESTGRDPSTRRQLSAMFGAMSESNNSAVADVLVDLANKCPDNYCKVQALMGVNTHSTPSLTNAKSLIDIATTSTDPEVAATAIIAAGAVGKRLDSSLPELPKEIIRTYNDPKAEAMKTSTIAAMGNHGNPEYLPILSKDITSDDSSIRAASVYSLRNIPSETVNPMLLKVIETEKITSVLSEAVKVAGMRKLSGDQYNQVAQRVAAFPNRELQEQTARMMVDVYRTNPDAGTAALNTLKDKATFPNVKRFIEEKMRQPETPAP